MNVSRFIGGIICLLVAALLALLHFALPENELMFMVGDQNASWLPPVILGVVGLLLLITAKSGTREPASAPGVDQGVTIAKDAGGSKADTDALQSSPQIALNKRLESIAWGCFLVMLGGSFIIPDNIAPNGLWTVGVGLIMLALNAARYYFGIRMSGFTTVLGILAVATGIAELLGFDLLGGALLLIILGIYLLLKPYFDRRQLFGKVESG